MEVRVRVRVGVRVGVGMGVVLAYGHLPQRVEEGERLPSGNHQGAIH